MPSANGVYSLPTGYLAVTGTTIQASQHNPPLEDIAAALTARLSRDGTAAMTGPIQFIPGTVGAPGAVFSTDLTSGLYKTTSGIGVAIAGVKVAEFLAGGVIGARFIGELIPYSGATVLPLTVLPFGQTLSRVTYPALWAFAQIQIAAGNLLYNNGDGSTTFGIMDVRGRVFACGDAIGGTPAARLGGTVTPSGAIFGSAGGAENNTIVTANLPPYTPSGTIVNGAITISGNAASFAAGNTIPNNSPSGSFNNAPAIQSASQAASTFTGTAQGGTSTPFHIVQPTIVTNCLLFAGA